MRRAFVGLIAVMIVAVGAWWFGLPAVLRSPAYPAASPTMSETMASADAALAIHPADKGWASSFRPAVAAADDTARRLTAMGAQKSRDLLAIRAAQREMTARLDAADAFLREHPSPPGAAMAVASYRDGAARIRVAMDDALVGFLRFDWDRVRRATTEMTAGEASLARVRTALDEATAATPAASGEG